MKTKIKKRIIGKAISLALAICTLFSLLASTHIYASEQEENEVLEDCAYENKATSADESEFEKSSGNSLYLDENTTLTVASSSAEILSAIKSKAAFTLSGTISKGTKSKDINEYYDFSSASRFDIASWAEKAGLITEEEKIECYCDLIENRRFENIDCLTSVFDTIQRYEANNFISASLSAKIESALANPFEKSGENSERSIDNVAIWNTTNFSIMYDANETSENTAQEVAEYMNSIRTTYLNLGFTVPTWRYKVHLDPDVYSCLENGVVIEDHSIGGVCIKSTPSAPRITQSSITIYNFNSLNDTTKSTMYHEYFHAVQFLYNHHISWFTEATANWAVVAIKGTITSIISNAIKNFIDSSDTPMYHPSVWYGAVLFPCTIHIEYDGVNTILDIYEEYEERTARSLTEDDIISIIDDGIKRNNPNGSFTHAYRTMTASLFNTFKYYQPLGVFNDNIHDDADAIEWLTQRTVAITQNTNDRNIYTNFSGTLQPLTSDYYDLSIPNTFTEGVVKLEVTYSNNNGTTQVYTRKIPNTSSYIQYPVTENSKTTFIQTDFRKKDNNNNVIGTTGFGLVFSNIGTSANVTYSAKLTLFPKNDNINFTNNKRYVERSLYILAGETIEYNVTFDTAGYKLIQTFGGKDTKIELCSSSGTILASNDDSGYNLNGLLLYNVSANTQYKIRTRFYGTSTAGEAKLAITTAQGMLQSTATSLNTYESIYNITGTTVYTYTGTLQNNETRAIRFTPSSSGTYTIDIDCSESAYFYIIDPASTSSIVNGKDCNNGRVSISLTANKAYLIVYSGYTPSSATTGTTVRIRMERTGV